MIEPSPRTRATWGDRSDRPRPRLLDFRPVRKGKLLGFARVELPIGLRISNIAILVGRNAPFAMLPSKPQLDRDGSTKRDPNGKVLYAPVLEWRDEDLSNRFSDTVVSLVIEAHPGALDRGE